MCFELENWMHESSVERFNKVQRIITGYRDIGEMEKLHLTKRRSEMRIMLINLWFLNLYLISMVHDKRRECSTTSIQMTLVLVTSPKGGVSSLHSSGTG